jgi:hypothetical protein
MLISGVLGLGVGFILAGIVLFISSYTHHKRMRSPALIRWAGVVGVVIGFLLGLVAIFWQ